MTVERRAASGAPGLGAVAPRRIAMAEHGVDLGAEDQGHRADLEEDEGCDEAGEAAVDQGELASILLM